MNLTALKNLATSPDYTDRSQAAADPECPEEIFHALKNDKYPRVRIAVTANPNCPIEILHQLQNDCLAVEGIACNPTCPVELLEKIAANSNFWKAHEHIARNPSCPENLLYKFAAYEPGDHRGFVMRSAVVTNPNCPKQIFVDIATNPKSGNEKTEAGRHCPADVIPLIETHLSNGLAENPHCPAHILTKLYQRNAYNEDLKIHIVSHHNCPRELIETASMDRSPTIRNAAETRKKEMGTGTTQKTPATADILRQFFNYQAGKIRLDIKAATALTNATKGMFTSIGNITAKTWEKLTPEETAELKPLAKAYAAQLTQQIG